MLGEKCRIARTRVAAADRAVAGLAGGDATRGVAGDVELLAVLPELRVRLEAGRGLLREIRGEVVDVLVGQRQRQRVHDRVVALAGAEQQQLLADVRGVLAGEVNLVIVLYAVKANSKKAGSPLYVELSHLKR